MGVFSEVAEQFRRSDDPSRIQPVNETLPTINDLIIAASKAMDLLEGKPLRSAMKVAVIAGAIAKMMQLTEREVASVVYAALLHDIGLVRLLNDIFPHLPPGVTEKQLFQNHALQNARVIGNPFDQPLSNELYPLFRQHPLAAKDFLRQLCLSQDVGDFISTHHELCDGTGYPLGLVREQIPLGGRIVSFADVVECVLEHAGREKSLALTSRRHALDSFLEIKAPEKFDPDVIATFVALLDANEDFIKLLSTLELEHMVRFLLPDRLVPLDGATLLSVMEAFGGLADTTLPLYKAGRSRRVADLAMVLADNLGIHREQCGELAIAAMVMDIGHLATPAAILLKRAPLSADERAIIHDHPMWTQEVLKNIPGFANISLWASEHHERLNGKGYPGNKKGYEISIGGRILALADVFDALTSPRPYRQNFHEPMDALPIIGQGRMTLYDNQLVNLLRSVVLNRDIPVA